MPPPSYSMIPQHTALLCSASLFLNTRELLENAHFLRQRLTDIPVVVLFFPQLQVDVSQVETLDGTPVSYYQDCWF